MTAPYDDDAGASGRAPVGPSAPGRPPSAPSRAITITGIVGGVAGLYFPLPSLFFPPFPLALLAPACVVIWVAAVVVCLVAVIRNRPRRPAVIALVLALLGPLLGFGLVCAYIVFQFVLYDLTG